MFSGSGLSNNNFESKLNTRSTPKKQQSSSTSNDKKLSMDVLYSEFLNLKDETNISFNNTNRQINKNETEIENLRHEVELLKNDKASLMQMENRLYSMEAVIISNQELAKQFIELKFQVNDLANNIKILEETKTLSQNSLEKILQANITESFKTIQLSLDGNMNTINKMFTDNYSKSSSTLTQINQQIDSKTNVIPATSSESMIKQSQMLDTKSSLFTKPVQTSYNISNSKLKGDLIETEINKERGNILVSPNLENKESSKISEDINVIKSDTNNQKNSAFSISYNKDPSKSLFGTNDKVTESIVKNSPSKDSDKSKLGLFSTLNTTIPPPSSEPLFASLNSQNSSIFGHSQESSKTTSFFGSKTSSENVSLFGNKTSSENVSLFGNKTSSDNSQGLFGNKSSLDNSQGLFGNKSTSDNSQGLFGNKSTSDNSQGLFGNKSTSDNPQGLFGNKSTVDHSQGLFGNQKPLSTTSSTNLFGNTPNPSFSFLSKPEAKVFNTNSDTPSFSQLSTTEGKLFGSTSEVNWKAGPQLFSNVTENNEEGNEQNPEDEEHDPHFQPIIELPPLVHILKDEESHDVLFKNRCKLYRFINNEWKERGVGEMKILQTKAEVGLSKPVKLLMRREQVRKICCNQRVTKNVPSFASMPNVKSTCWVGNDFSESEPSQEKFAIRFSHVNILNEFQDIIAKIQEEMTSEECLD